MQLSQPGRMLKASAIAAAVGKPRLPNGRRFPYRIDRTARVLWAVSAVLWVVAIYAAWFGTVIEMVIFTGASLTVRLSANRRLHRAVRLLDATGVSVPTAVPFAIRFFGDAAERAERKAEKLAVRAESTHRRDSDRKTSALQRRAERYCRWARDCRGYASYFE